MGFTRLASSQHLLGDHSGIWNTGILRFYGLAFLHFSEPSPDIPKGTRPTAHIFAIRIARDASWVPRLFCCNLFFVSRVSEAVLARAVPFYVFTANPSPGNSEEKRNWHARNRLIRISATRQFAKVFCKYYL